MLAEEKKGEGRWKDGSGRRKRSRRRRRRRRKGWKRKRRKDGKIEAVFGVT